jgi:hypothetical protein
MEGNIGGHCTGRKEDFASESKTNLIDQANIFEYLGNNALIKRANVPFTPTPGLLRSESACEWVYAAEFPEPLAFSLKVILRFDFEVCVPEARH